MNAHGCLVTMNDHVSCISDVLATKRRDVSHKSSNFWDMLVVYLQIKNEREVSKRATSQSLESESVAGETHLTAKRWVVAFCGR